MAAVHLPCAFVGISHSVAYMDPGSRWPSDFELYHLNRFLDDSLLTFPREGTDYR